MIGILPDRNQSLIKSDIIHPGVDEVEDGRVLDWSGVVISVVLDYLQQVPYHHCLRCLHGDRPGGGKVTVQPHLGLSRGVEPHLLLLRSEVAYHFAQFPVPCQGVEVQMQDVGEGDML